MGNTFDQNNLCYEFGSSVESEMTFLVGLHVLFFWLDPELISRVYSGLEIFGPKLVMHHQHM